MKVVFINSDNFLPFFIVFGWGRIFESANGQLGIEMKCIITS